MDIEIKAIDIMGVLSPCDGVLKAIAENKDKNANIFKSKGLEYILEFKWNCFAKYIYGFNLILFFIIWLSFNVSKLYLST